MEIHLSTKISSLILKNPVMPASGTFGYGIEYIDFIDLNELGAIVTKGLSIYPKEGNPPPRILEGDGYLMNYIGLENIGINNFISEKLPILKKFNTPIIVNCFGRTKYEYIEIAKLLNDINEIPAIEVNVSCPNVEKGGIEFGLDQKDLFEIVNKIRKVYSKTLIVKISPMLSDIISAGRIIEEAGADAITAINTIKGLRINVYNNERFKGGISGRFLKPIALRIVNELSEKINIPIIGCGGISNVWDVIEYIKAGAKAVQVGTFNFVRPDIMIKIIQDLERIMKLNKFKNVEELKNGKIQKIN